MRPLLIIHVNPAIMKKTKIKCQVCGETTTTCNCQALVLQRYYDLTLTVAYVHQVLLNAYASAEKYHNDATLLHIGHALGRLQNIPGTTIPTLLMDDPS